MEEIDFQRLRDLMVESQLIPRRIKDVRVLDVMKKVPRHLFLTESLRDEAYNDMALPTTEGQTISQPYMVAVMTELLELKGGEKILEIGTGSGYQTAILAELSREVYTIERVQSLSDSASKTLAGLGYDNIYLKHGDGTLGWPEEAPFDRILITAAAPDLPEILLKQLSDGGIIIAPVGDRFSQQLVKGTKRGEKIDREHHTPCVFVPLIGEYGWSSW